MNKSYFVRLKTQLIDGDISLVAASLAFTTVLSIVPFLAVSLAIIQKLGGLEMLYPKVEKLILLNFTDAIGEPSVKFIKAALRRMMSGKMGSLGALVLILTSTRLVYDLEKAIHKVWNIKNKRSIIQRITYYWLCILLFPFGLAIYTALISTKEIDKFSVQIFALFGFLLMIYKIVPNLKVSWSSAITGSIVGTVMLIFIHRIFVWFTQIAFDYGKLYGGIASVPLFLLWVLVIWYAILFGAIVSASFKHEFK